MKKIGLVMLGVVGMVAASSALANVYVDLAPSCKALKVKTVADSKSFANIDGKQVNLNTGGKNDLTAASQKAKTVALSQLTLSQPDGFFGLPKITTFKDLKTVNNPRALSVTRFTVECSEVGSKLNITKVTSGNSVA